jgi:signal transduction histidine kinase
MKTEDGDMELRPQELSLLNQIGREFSSTLDLRIIIGRVMSRVKEVLGCDASSVILYDEIKDSLVFYAASGVGAREVTGLAIPKGRGIAGWVYVHGSPIVVSDAANDSRFYPGIDKITGIATRSLICVPIQKNDRVLGVIEGINKEGTFDQKDLEMLTAIAHLAAIAIENSKTHENLERKNSELLDVNREMEEFVHIVSHDLQAPLVSIGGYVNLIEKEVANQLRQNGTLQGYLERIEVSCKSTLQFVRRLLDYSRLRNSSIVIDVFSPLGVLNEVKEQLREEIEQDGATFIHPRDLPTIRYDRTLFHHILLNLIQNSLKYASPSAPGTSAPGTSALGTSALGTSAPGTSAPGASHSEDFIIEVGCHEEAYEYHFFVRDSGPGLSKEDQKRIFNIYERGGSSELTNGYGIGLAFVKKAVQMMNGTVWVESRKGSGTTFFFSVKR